MEILLDERQTLVIAILVLFLGKYLNKRISAFQNLNIPQPVTGGVLASIVIGLIYLLSGSEVIFDLNLRDILLITFFTTIGLSSKFSALVKGGRLLILLTSAALAFLVLQNLVGLAITATAGVNLNIGLIGGSVSLSGGHGTAIAWAPTFSEQFGVLNASEIGVACATFGLILGGVIGGPVAGFLIARYQLESHSTEPLVTGLPLEADTSRVEIDVDSVLRTILIIAISVGLGLVINSACAAAGLMLPEFVTSLFAGIILTNSLPRALPQLRENWPAGTPALALVSDLSLGLFLAMSLMSLQLWTLVDLAGPILLVLIAQVLLIVTFAVFVVFRLMGRNYDAAVITGGYVGLGLGATPTAVANMEAITQKFGPSPTAFIVVPLVGAFFIDIANAVIVTFLVDLIN